MKETRTVKVKNLNVEERSDEKPVITGYASVFNTSTEIYSWLTEEVAPGAFTKTIQEADVRALLNHDSNFVLGRNKSGTLRLSEDSIGLKTEIDVPDTQWAKDLVISMKRGDIDSMSFAFEVVKAEWDYDKEVDHRVIKEAKLYDVSIVTFAAYPTTTASVRSLIEIKDNDKAEITERDKVKIKEYIKELRGKIEPDEDVNNLEKLQEVLTKSTRGEDLSEPDMEMLKLHYEHIQSIVEPTTRNESHSNDQKEPVEPLQADVDEALQRRRKLQILLKGL
jgi:HK97 family phage prohead protease